MLKYVDVFPPFLCDVDCTRHQYLSSGERKGSAIGNAVFGGSQSAVNVLLLIFLSWPPV